MLLKYHPPPPQPLLQDDRPTADRINVFNSWSASVDGKKETQPTFPREPLSFPSLNRRRPTLHLWFQACKLSYIDQKVIILYEPFWQPKIVQGEGAITSAVTCSMWVPEQRVQSIDFVWLALLEPLNLDA